MSEAVFGGDRPIHSLFGGGNAGNAEYRHEKFCPDKWVIGGNIADNQADVLTNLDADLF